MSKRGTYFGISASVIAITCALAANQAFAGEAGAETAPPTVANGTGQEDSGLVEIVVTATKRRENLQKVAASITTVSGDALVRQGITNIGEIENSVPSVGFAQEGSNTKLYIRGIGSYLDTAGITPVVSYTVDGLTVPREGTSTQLFDVSQIEVLKGPQGTLYGRGAVGGVILISNNRPTNDYSTSATLELGNYSERHSTAVVNLPISNTLAVRVAGDYFKHGPYQESGADTANNGTVRVSALWRPNDQFSAYIWGQDATIDGGYNANSYPFLHGDPWNDLGPTGKTPQLNDPYGSTYLRVHTQEAAAEFSYTTDKFTLTYEPTYLDLRQDENEAQGAYGSWAARGTTIYAYSQEIKLLSPSTSGLKWILGGYWYKQHYGDYHFIFSGYNAFDTPDVNEESYVTYGEITYPVTDRFRLTAGGRYQNAHKDAVGYDPAGDVWRAAQFTFDHTWNPVDWKVGLEADLAPEMMAYAVVQTGWGEGSFQNFPSTPALSNYIAPSTQMSYTGGVKSRWLDNKVQFNVEGFYYTYKDLILQAFDATNGISRNFNVPKSVMYGGEFDTNVRLTANTSFYLNAGYLVAHPTEFTAGGVNYAGYQLEFSPTFSGAVGLSHDWGLGSGAKITGAVDAHFSSKYWMAFTHDPNLFQKPYTKSDASITYYSANGKWNLGLWVRNLENVYVWASSAPSGGTTILGTIEDPRTYGMRLRVNF